MRPKAALNALPELDVIFHQPVRTRVGVLLSRGARSFAQLKSELRITDGNLDAHLRKLSSAGYLHSEMVFDGRPRTDYALSSSGSKAFARYLRDLDGLLKAAATGKRR